MIKTLLLAVCVLFVPVATFAAPSTFIGDRSLLVASSTDSNLYAAGGTVTLTAPVSGDVAAFGGTVVDEASTRGDALLVGGSVRSGASVSGDARIFGGSVVVAAPVAGDLAALAGSFTSTVPVGKNVFVVAANASLAGAAGPVTLYANTVTLSGTFSGDVYIHASGRIALAEGTIIKGSLEYQAPEEALIPASAMITGGVHYTGASYLPTSEEAHAIALASFGIFLFIKILGALILAGLIAGLFPKLTTLLVVRVFGTTARQMLLITLLGFALMVVTPLLLFLLSITFIGLGLAFIVGLGYVLALCLAFIFSGSVVGSLFARLVFKRSELRWSDSVLGMLAFFLVWSLPYIGWIIALVVWMYLLGILTLLFYDFAFPREGELGL